MIDVLAAMAIVSSVIFSLLFYQMEQLQVVHSALYRTIAINQIDNLTDMIQRNNQSKKQRDILSVWNNDNSSMLPQAVGEILDDSSHKCLITLQWFYLKIQAEQIYFRC